MIKFGVGLMKVMVVISLLCLSFCLVSAIPRYFLPRVGVAQRGSVVVRVRMFVCLSVCPFLKRISGS